MSSMRLREVGAAAAAGFITFILYMPALRHGFVNWDDDVYVYGNPHIRSLGPEFWKWAVAEFHAANWHPLTWLSHALDYRLWGLMPAGHHLTNNLLHSANTVLVMLVVFGLIQTQASLQPGGKFQSGLSANGRITAAALSGLLFGLHPLHVESVAWISERKDLLSACFYLLSLLMYLRHVKVGPDDRNGKRPVSRHYGRAVFFFICALLSKPMAISLPLIMLILDWYPLGRLNKGRTFRTVLEKAPFLLLSLGSAVVTILAQRSGNTLTAFAVVPPAARVMVGSHALTSYLAKVFWPFDLAPLYPYPSIAQLSAPAYIIALLTVPLVMVAAVLSVKRSRIFLCLVGCYVVMLLPVLGFVQVGSQAMADRYTYLPMISIFSGISIASVSIAGAVEARRTLRAMLLSVCMLLLLFFITRTYSQTQIWKDSLSLWNHELSLYPDVPVALRNRGDALMEKGFAAEALRDYSQALELNPSFAVAFNQRGIALVKLGDPERALTDFSAAVRLSAKPEFSYFNNRGAVYAKLGRYEEAVADYTRALSLNTSAIETYRNRGMAYKMLGHAEAAQKDILVADQLRSGMYQQQER